MSRLAKMIARLRADERASLSIETVIIFPLLVWAYLAMYVFLDGFRSQSLYQIHGMMTLDRQPTRLRLTVVRWDEGDNQDA